MSLLRAIKAQLGLSATPANNFVLDASADNGTMKLARGNAEATVQDIMTVDAAGKVAFPSQGQSLATPGYIKLPGGLILQWGFTNTLDAGSVTVTLPVPFPTAILGAVASLQADNAAGATSTCSVTFKSTSTISIGSTDARTTGNGAWVARPVGWFAIGY